MRPNQVKRYMKIILLVVGRTTDAHFKAGIEAYTERIGHYAAFELKVLPDLKNTKNLSEEVQKEREGEMILKFLQPGDVPVLLDEHGEERRSVEFASWLQKMLNGGGKRLVFIIGGPYGFSPDVYGAARTKVSLSKMTFSHQMIRLVFTEQLYRAFTILKGEPYHHE